MSAPYRMRHPDSGLRKVSSGGDTFRLYLERLMKLIPAEVVGLYLVGAGFVPESAPLGLVAWSVVCLLAVVVVRAVGTSDPDDGVGPQWVPVALSTVAFVLWLYSLGGPFAAYGLAVPWVGSLLVLGFSFFVPYVYKGPRES